MSVVAHFVGRGGRNRRPTSDQAFNRTFESGSALSGERPARPRWWGNEVPLTSGLMDTLASSEPDPESALIAAEEDAAPEPPEEQVVVPERVLAIIRGFVPPEEAYLLEAYFVRGQYQGVIASRLGRVKQSVQYRLNRAVVRIRWALTLESWDRTEAQMADDLGAALSRDELRFAGALWSNKWNQSRTAQALGATQSNVRIRIMRLHKVLVEHQAEGQVGPYARDLTRVIEAKAWNMGNGQVQGRRAIGFPKFGRRGGR